MRVKQEDIARIANVSQATVSRVLSGDERVEPEIRDRVKAIIKQENYQPDVRARNLRQKRTHLIGLVLKREPGVLKDDPFFAALVSQVVECLAGTPYHLCVDIAADSSKQAHIYDELLRTRRVDGLILVESESHDERLNRLEQDKFPFVLIGKAPKGTNITSIDNDNVEAAKMAAEHLIEQGYKNIAMLAGPRGLTVTEDRVAGYELALNDAKLPTTVIHADFGMNSARNAAIHLLNDKNRPDAILTMDDTMALGAVSAARELKVSIPNELGIMGFNDSAVCDLVDGGLSSVNLSIDKMVRWCIRQLVDGIEGEMPNVANTEVVPTFLRSRGSTERRAKVSVS